jgi:uncharacterized protein YdcH (DUF465 family)
MFSNFRNLRRPDVKLGFVKNDYGDVSTNAEAIAAVSNLNQHFMNLSNCKNHIEVSIKKIEGRDTNQLSGDEIRKLGELKDHLAMITEEMGETQKKLQSYVNVL